MKDCSRNENWYSTKGTVPLLKILGPTERYILSEIVKAINNGTDGRLTESVAVRLFGSITPIFFVPDISTDQYKQCSDSSWTYLIALASLISNPNPEETSWAMWTAPCKIFMMPNLQKFL